MSRVAAGRASASRPDEDNGASPLLPSLHALRLTDAPPSAPLSDICPVCKSSRYLNPNMRFLVNPECYHKMCESCVDRIFSHGPAPCPVAGCHRTLRKQRFRKQTFGDIQVEKEVDVRKRVAKVQPASFNRREPEFETLLDYNNYLEDVETITFNLLNGVDLPSTEAKLASYAAQNADTISRNDTLRQEESASLEAHNAFEKEQARLRREAARLEADEERREKDDGKRDILDRLAKSDGDAAAITRDAQALLKRNTDKRRAVPSSQARVVPDNVHHGAGAAAGGAGLANGAAAAELPYVIKGLKRTVAPEPEKAYDPFGGRTDRREYFVQQDVYEHPWLDRARTDPSITAGGYDVREYHTRALVEAFSGLGVFVADKEGG
ncbi:MAG: TFIIH/NER complex subunit [Piccolia ochrophora]|nr:MAG: TFIIH/NER complex subunit [Piccolia ochrophora]